VIDIEELANLFILFAAGWVAWVSIRPMDDRQEDQAEKEPAEPASQGRIFKPTTHGRVAGVSRNGGWWE